MERERCASHTRPRTLWDCAVKTFDIGIASGSRPHQLQLTIQPGTLEQVAALGASLVVTVYAVEPRVERE
jgi:hypothetical protein